MVDRVNNVIVKLIWLITINVFFFRNTNKIRWDSGGKSLFFIDPLFGQDILSDVVFNTLVLTIFTTGSTYTRDE